MQLWPSGRPSRIWRKAAGVSVATVDRVLNGRLPVREETARRVYEAANAIGYHAAGLIRQRLQQDLPQYRLGFILQRPNQAFYQAFAREIGTRGQCAAPISAASPQIEFLQSQTPAEIAAKLQRLSAPAARRSPWWRPTIRRSRPRWRS